MVYGGQQRHRRWDTASHATSDNGEWQLCTAVQLRCVNHEETPQISLRYPQAICHQHLRTVERSGHRAVAIVLRIRWMTEPHPHHSHDSAARFCLTFVEVRSEESQHLDQKEAGA